jgi:ankyrin repeat protein
LLEQLNSDGEALVHVAAGRGRRDAIEILAAKGANLAAVDRAGDSALSWAARQGNNDVLQFLLSKSGDINHANNVSDVKVRCCREDRFKNSDALNPTLEFLSGDLAKGQKVTSFAYLL